MKNIIHQQHNLPEQIPVMVLPGTLLFPNSLLPLYIFEERYREMLAHCLERSRMFCIAQIKPGLSDAMEDDDFFHVAGLGLIRACIGNQDGTSHLMLQGLARVRLVNFIQHEPFRVAQIQELESKGGNPVEAEALSAKVLELCRTAPETGDELQEVLNKQFSHTHDPEIVSDFVAQAFVQDPMQRQEILEELSVCERLRKLIACLKS
ncbi:MAG: LON peptidase substrate-binding domain-containing protein [Chthoniobacteraceae bacterium]